MMLAITEEGSICGASRCCVNSDVPHTRQDSAGRFPKATQHARALTLPTAGSRAGGTAFSLGRHGDPRALSEPPSARPVSESVLLHAFFPLRARRAWNLSHQPTEEHAASALGSVGPHGLPVAPGTCDEPRRLAAVALLSGDPAPKDELTDVATYGCPDSAHPLSASPNFPRQRGRRDRRESSTHTDTASRAGQGGEG